MRVWRAAILQRQCFGHALDHLGRGHQAMGGLRGPREEFGRRVNTDDLTHGLGVERKVQARADPDLQHTSMQPGGGAAPVGKKLILAHRQMRQPREDMFLVQSHLFTRSAQGQGVNGGAKPGHWAAQK